MRKRLRHHHHEAELNITAFLNLMVILIPFLLITAAFSRFAILELICHLPVKENCRLSRSCSSRSSSVKRAWKSLTNAAV